MTVTALILRGGSSRTLESPLAQELDIEGLCSAAGLPGEASVTLLSNDRPVGPSLSLTDMDDSRRRSLSDELIFDTVGVAHDGREVTAAVSRRGLYVDVRYQPEDWEREVQHREALIGDFVEFVSRAARLVPIEWVVVEDGRCGWISPMVGIKLDFKPYAWLGTCSAETAEALNRSELFQVRSLSDEISLISWHGSPATFWTDGGREAQREMFGDAFPSLDPERVRRGRDVAWVVENVLAQDLQV